MSSDSPPLKSQIGSLGFPALIKFDFHMHTLDDPYDHHVYHTAFELIDKAARLGFQALSITLHTRQLENKEIGDYAAAKGILLIPGVEQDIQGAHVLLINFPKAVSENISTFAQLDVARRELRESGAPENLVVAPHPFFPSGVALQNLFWDYAAAFDAVEVSGFYHQFWNPNRKAMTAAEKLGLPLIGNSDTHTLEQFGTTWSEAHCPLDAESLIREIKAGRTRIAGRSLRGLEMGTIAWKVIAQGYMKWINYKRTRGYQPRA